MVVLHSIVAAASLAGFVSASAMVPQPSPGQAQLKIRHSSKMDIVRRASNMRKRQGGPSAVPTPRIMCGEQPANEPFYITAPKPNSPTSYVYFWTSYADVLNSATGQEVMSWREDSAGAIPYEFDDACHLTAIGGDSPVRAVMFTGPTSGYVRMATEQWAENNQAEPFTCIVTNGVLQCGGNEMALPLLGTEFCQSWFPEVPLLSVSSVGCNAYDAYATTLNVHTVPPQNPKLCGVQEVGVPFYLSAISPVNQQTIYAHVENGNIIGGAGTSPLYQSTSSNGASAFVFDDDCRVHYTTPGGVSTTFYVGNDVTAGIPAFGTDAAISPAAVDWLYCTSDTGDFRCGTDAQGQIPITTSIWCQTGNLYFTLSQSSSTTPGCQNIDFQVLASLPPP